MPIVSESGRVLIRKLSRCVTDVLKKCEERRGRTTVFFESNRPEIDSLLVASRGHRKTVSTERASLDGHAFVRKFFVDSEVGHRPGRCSTA